MYFHKLTDAEFRALPEMTLEELMERFKQPDWCTYKNALEGVLGCRPLLSRQVRAESDCKMCECHVARVEKSVATGRRMREVQSHRGKQP